MHRLSIRRQILKVWQKAAQMSVPYFQRHLRRVTDKEPDPVAVVVDPTLSPLNVVVVAGR